MRKRILVIFVVAVGVALGGYNKAELQNDKNALSVLALVNVEALAERGHASNNWKCSGWWGTCKAYCGLCGTKIEGTGSLEGAHFCPRHSL